MQIKVTLETQSGPDFLIGYYASLAEASKTIKRLDAAWERGDRSTTHLRNWEGSDVTASANGVTYLLAGDGVTGEEWEEI